MTTKSTVLTERIGSVVHLILNRPEKLNALTPSILEQLGAAATAAATEAGVRAVVIRGAGRAFCAGVDVAAMAGLSTADAREFISLVHRTIAAVRQLPVPVVAEVHGVCFGAALEMVLTCDLRVAATTARFGMPEIRMGIPSVVDAALLPRVVGEGMTRELVLTGEAIDAETAQRVGLVNRVVPAAQLRATTVQLLELVLRNAPGALRAQKQLLNLWQAVPLERAIDDSIAVFSRCFEGDEPRQAMHAFLNRERP